MGYITGWIVVGIITLGIYKLFELFVGKKERQWVLCCGERIAWLIGERIDNRFRIDETTKRVVIYKIV